MNINRFNYLANGEVGEDLVVEVYVLFHLRIMVVLFIIIFKILNFEEKMFASISENPYKPAGKFAGEMTKKMITT